MPGESKNSEWDITFPGLKNLAAEGGAIRFSYRGPRVSRHKPLGRGSKKWDKSRKRMRATVPNNPTNFSEPPQSAEDQVEKPGREAILGEQIIPRNTRDAIVVIPPGRLAPLAPFALCSPPSRVRYAGKSWPQESVVRVTLSTAIRDVRYYPGEHARSRVDT